jgi:hypothetical protein
VADAELEIEIIDGETLFLTRLGREVLLLEGLLEGDGEGLETNSVTEPELECATGFRMKFLVGDDINGDMGSSSVIELEGEAMGTESARWDLPSLNILLGMIE